MGGCSRGCRDFQRWSAAPSYSQGQRPLTQHDPFADLVPSVICAERSSGHGAQEYEEYAIDAHAPVAYVLRVIFVEAPDFTRQITALLEDDDYARLQAYLAQHPDVGDVMQGTGGETAL